MNEKNIDLNTFLGLLDNGLRREGDETFAVSSEGIGALRMKKRDWKLLFREEQAPLLAFESEARLAFPCSLEAVRAWVERNWHEMPESLAKALEEAAQVNATGRDAAAPVEHLPGKGPILRRKRLACILAVLQEIDPSLNLAAMPGTKADLFSLCQALDTKPKQFAIALRTFDNGIATAWLQFKGGGRPGMSPYYQDRLEIVRSKLARL